MNTLSHQSVFDRGGTLQRGQSRREGWLAFLVSSVMAMLFGSVREREKFPVQRASGGGLAKRLMAGFAKLVLLLSVGSFGTLAYADLVTLKPTAYPSKICSGQSFDVTFGVESTSIINKMYAWLSFDPALLQGNTATGLVTGGTAMAEFASLGAMVFTAPSSTLNIPAGNTNLFTFNFTPLAVGATNLTFREDLTWSKRVDVDPDIDMPVDTLLPQVNQGLQLTVENCGGNPPGPNTLTVTKVGTATGTVTSTSAGINCGEDCTEEYPLNTQVTLIASPISTFAGWSGACSGISTTTIVTMDAAKNCIATFGEVPPNCDANVLYSELNVCHLNHIDCVVDDLSNCDAIKAECDDNVQRLYGLCYKLNVTKVGNGTVTSTGGLGGTLGCGSTCSDYYAFDDKVTLTATTGVTWSGACSGTASSCVVTIPAAIQTDVTATFSDTPAKVRLDVTKTGNGTITSTPAGISCDTDCTEDYALNTQVTLTATAASGSTFAGWGGACSGTSPTVTVTMDAAKNCTATFALAVPKISVTPYTSQSFGIVGIGYPVTKAFTLSNTGTANLVVGKLSMVTSPVFAIQEDTCSNQTIAPAGTCTINVKFSPTMAFGTNLYLYVPSNDPVKPTLTLQVSGKGVYMPNLVINTTTDFGNFGDVAVGSASTTQDLTISNTGSGNLKVETVTLTNSTDFSRQSDTCSNQTIVPNGTCTIKVAFAPKTAGAKSSELKIPSNAPGSPHNRPLAGSGNNPTFNLTVVKKGTVVVRHVQPKPTEVKGIVTAHDSNIGGINCGDGGTKCLDPYDQGSTVTLTATHTPFFDATNGYSQHVTVLWSEPSCVQGSPVQGNPTCEVKMDASKTVTVTFFLPTNIAVHQFGGPDISHNDTLDLGIASQQSGVSQALLIVNGYPNYVEAGANLLISGFTLEGADASAFEVVSRAFPLMWWDNVACSVTTPVTLGFIDRINNQCGMKVGIKQGMSAGVKNATLVIRSNDPDTAEFKINLRGEVVALDDKQVSDVACPPSLQPTIKSTLGYGQWSNDVDGSSDGDWERIHPSTGPLIPQADDVVLIQKDHEMLGIQSAKVKALCVEKDGILSNYATSLTIEATDGISNYGTITSKDPFGGPPNDQPCVEKDGKSVILKAGKSIATDPTQPEHGSANLGAPIYNVGTIEAGNGGNGETCAGKGGNAQVLGRNVLNEGTIRAGNGGKATISNVDGVGHGGHTEVWGRLAGPGFLINKGEIYSGNGGDGCPSGNGGNVGLYADPNLVPGKINGKAEVESTDDVVILGNSIGSLNKLKPYGALPGSNLTPCSKTAGVAGNVWLEPSVINFANAKIFGGDVVIFGGENWVLDLSKANRLLVEATGDITLQVGKNSVVDLSGNQTTVLKAAGKVTILSDEIRLDEGITLSDVIEATEIVTGPSKIRYAVSVMGPGKTVGKPNTVLPVRVTIGNSGPTLDTYDLSISDTAGWPISAIEPSIALEGLDVIDLPLDVTLPDTLGAVNVITVTAISQIDPTVTATTEVVIEVTDGKIVLPQPKPGTASPIKVETTYTVKELGQGNHITYTVTITNTGTETATGVIFTDTIAEGTELLTIKADSSGRGCDKKDTNLRIRAPDFASCELPDLTPGASIQVELVVQNKLGQEPANYAQVNSDNYPVSFSTIPPDLLLTEETDATPAESLPNPVQPPTDATVTPPPAQEPPVVVKTENPVAEITDATTTSDQTEKVAPAEEPAAVVTGQPTEIAVTSPVDKVEPTPTQPSHSETAVIQPTTVENSEPPVVPVQTVEIVVIDNQESPVVIADQTDVETVVSPPAKSDSREAIVELPPPSEPACLATDKVIDEFCNYNGQTLTNVTITKYASISNVALAGVNTSEGWIANSTLLAGATLSGGTLTGRITNYGLISDIEFRGVELSGGTLSGLIRNNSSVKGVIKDVKLAIGTRLSGGRLSGEIEGDPNGPAVLENVILLQDCKLVNVIKGEGVVER